MVKISRRKRIFFVVAHCWASAIATVCSGDNSRASEFQSGLIGQLNKVDALVKTGAENGEVKKFGQAGGKDFAKARKLLEGIWKSAKTIDLRDNDQDLFNKIAAQYLAFFVRTTCDYQTFSKEVLNAYGRSGPSDPTVLYLLGLSALRDAQLRNTDAHFETALKYVNASLATGKELPEAHWLKAQILAVRGGRLDQVKKEHAAVVRLSSEICPFLYLYDTDTINAIKRAAKND